MSVVGCPTGVGIGWRVLKGAVGLTNISCPLYNPTIATRCDMLRTT
tara:strand:+ start:592 stop:729 length:138 start_codon:yes stop_codon:yes gene_type:complete